MRHQPVHVLSLNLLISSRACGVIVGLNVLVSIRTNTIVIIILLLSQLIILYPFPVESGSSRSVGGNDSVI